MESNKGSSSNLGGEQGNLAQIETGIGNWTVSHHPATAAVATATKAAAAGVRHICNAIIASLAAGGTAQGPVQVVLRDGLTGVGAILATFSLSAPVNGCAGIALSGLNFVGTPGNAMTLEFVSAPGTGVQADVTLGGYDAT